MLAAEGWAGMERHAMTNPPEHERLEAEMTDHNGSQRSDGTVQRSRSSGRNVGRVGAVHGHEHAGTVDAYRDAMDAIITRVEDTMTGGEAPCPACPGWTVRDVVAHVCHLASDAAAGSLPVSLMEQAVCTADPARRMAAAEARDRYIEDGIEARRALTWAELLQSWEIASATAGDPHPLAVGDVVVHLLDIDAALGIMTDEAPHVLAAGVRAMHRMQQDHLRAVGLAPVAWVAYDLDLELGAADASECITGASSWLLRTAAGRQSRRDADRYLDWGRTPEQTRSAFALHGGWRST